MASSIYKSRIGIGQNLPSGATYDLLMISFPDGYPQSKLVFEIADTPRKITGIQKVSQLFVKVLFTRKGSNVVYSQQGTYFSDYTINANRIDSDPILYAELTEQIQDAESQVKYILNTVGSDPASQLARISILGMDANQDSLVMYIRILTNAGAQASIAIPFPQLDLNITNEQS